ncbi:MAG: hypothetical protein ACP5FZ_03460 [Fidelibacterota bacterium]
MTDLEFEELCIRCGGCCGAFDGDPCEHLRRGDDGLCYCAIYENRFGWHKTVCGRKLECVPIMERLHDEWIGDHLCAYKGKFLKEG